MSAPDLFAVAAAQRASSMPRPSIAKRGRRIAFNVTEGEDVRTITPAGRDAWALGELVIAGANGCTPIDQPGPRWSHYVWKLRTVHGLDVETITESHGGEFAGHHARYRLQQHVEFADPADRARAEGSRYA